MNRSNGDARGGGLNHPVRNQCSHQQVYTAPMASTAQHVTGARDPVNTDDVTATANKQENGDRVEKISFDFLNSLILFFCLVLF